VPHAHWHEVRRPHRDCGPREEQLLHQCHWITSHNVSKKKKRKNFLDFPPAAHNPAKPELRIKYRHVVCVLRACFPKKVREGACYAPPAPGRAARLFPRQLWRERSCGENTNQRAGDLAGFLLVPGGSSRRMRLSLSAESYVYFSLPTHPTPSWGLVLQ
jgi:hypothetical protein